MASACSSSASPAVRRISVADFAQLPDHRGLDLDDGIVLETPRGALASWIGGNLSARISDHVDQLHLGWAFSAGAPYACFPPDAIRVRKPAVSFVQHGRLPNERLPDGFMTIAPDIAAEVVSPTDTVYYIERKVRQFLSAGVRLVWVILPETRDARIYRPGRTVTGVEPDGYLDGEDVIPGFRVRLTDLFPPETPTA